MGSVAVGLISRPRQWQRPDHVIMTGAVPVELYFFRVSSQATFNAEIVLFDVCLSNLHSALNSGDAR